MPDLTRRSVLAAARGVTLGTVAAAAAIGKLRAQALQTIGSLHALSQPRKLDLHWTAADGSAVSLTDYAGRAVVLNLWATWCVPCVREMAALDDLAGAVAKDGIVVLPLSSDRGGASVVQRFYAQEGIKRLPVMLDLHGDVAHALEVRGIPTTLLIDRQGQEVGWLEGAADWSSDDAVTVVRKVATFS